MALSPSRPIFIHPDDFGVSSPPFSDFIGPMPRKGFRTTFAGRAATAIFNSKRIYTLQEKGVRQGLGFVAIVLQKRIRNRLSRTGSGKQYPGNPAKSSSPDQPPVAQSGRLRNSWVAAVKTMRRRPGRRITLRVSQGAGFPEASKYAYYLEYGTKHMEPRPFIEPSVKTVQPRAAKLFNMRYKKVIESINRSGPHG
jgi:HK97 gp10 family phage protein